MEDQEYDVEEMHEEDEMDTEDVAYEAHHKVDALIDLLIKKNVITDGEFEEQISKLVDEMAAQEEEDDDEECCEGHQDSCCGDKPQEHQGCGCI